MADNQYDVSPKLLRLYKEKEKLRENVRQAVLKRTTNPHMRFGDLYDGAITKYHSLWYYRNEHVYSNARNVTALFAGFFIPVGLLFYDMVRHRNNKEKLLRSGKVAYEDRCYKQLV